MSEYHTIYTHTDSMKIAFIHPSYPGVDTGTGATFSATKIVEGIQNNGHTVTVYCMDSPRSEVCVDDVILEDISPEWNPHSPLSLYQSIRSRLGEFNEFDIVHSYPMTAIGALKEIREQTGTHIVQTLNAYGAVCPKNDLMYADSKKCNTRSTTRCAKCIAKTNIQYPIKNTVARSVFHFTNLYLIEQSLPIDRTIDAYHALSPTVAQRYSEFGVNRERVHTIPNIIDEEFEAGDQAQENTKILFVGFFHKHKGVDRLIPIFERYVSQYDHSATLTIVGDGPLKNKLEGSVNSSLVSEQIDLRGKVQNGELPRLYANHSVFLFPARWDEPFGRVFLEAMATDTPVVATNTGSVKEIIDGAGIVVNSECNLPKALNKVISNRKEYIDKIDIERFRIHNVMPKFEKLYESVMSS